jgi:enamine deaminase RidA (YjgF/YER057c/UK114 family)
MERRTINPWRWQDRFGFVQAEEAVGSQSTLYCSGQTSTDGSGAPQHPGDMRAQLGLALDNLETVLKAAGYAVADIVRLNFYTTDVDQFLEHFDVVAGRLAGVRYSSTLLGVTRLAGPELLVEIEATASR